MTFNVTLDYPQNQPQRKGKKKKKAKKKNQRIAHVEFAFIKEDQ